MKKTFHEYLMGLQISEDLLMQTSEDRARNALNAPSIDLQELALLLSPGAAGLLEEMGQKAQKITRRQFGNIMNLYAPLYLSDFCVNQCLYCGFRVGEVHGRNKLNMEQVRQEGNWLYNKGFRQILLLTGESRKHSPPEYIAEAIRTLAPQFPMIGVEIYALETEEYRQLVDAGAESLTLYQETFDMDLYQKVHPAGPKADYQWRLNAPQRGCEAGMRSVNLGILMGLGQWQKEVLTMALHGRWLQRHYPGTQIGFSLPRLRPAVGMAYEPQDVTDREFVQALLALRMWMPDADLSLSTREKQSIRDGLMQLGITKMSADSKTNVGGYSILKDISEEQFAISDDRSLEDVKQAIENGGLEPVMLDWVRMSGGESVG